MKDDGSELEKRYTLFSCPSLTNCPPRHPPLEVSGFEPRASYVLGKHQTSDLPQASRSTLNEVSGPLCSALRSHQSRPAPRARRPTIAPAWPPASNAVVLFSKPSPGALSLEPPVGLEGGHLRDSLPVAGSCGRRVGGRLLLECSQEQMGLSVLLDGGSLMYSN